MYYAVVVAIGKEGRLQERYEKKRAEGAHVRKVLVTCLANSLESDDENRGRL